MNAPEGKAASPSPRLRLSLTKRITMSLVVSGAVLMLLALMGEAVCRWFGLGAGGEVQRDEDMALARISEDMYLGFELRPGVADHNDDGFRGPAVARSKPPGTRRIAFVGDSVTYGLGVRAAEAFPALLQQRLRATHAGPVEVLNFGVPAYSSFQELTLLKARVLDYEPDVVVMVFASDDTETSPVILEIDGQRCLFRNQFEGVGLLNNPVHWGLFRRSCLYRFLYQRAVLLRAGRGRFDEVYRQPEVAWQNVLQVARLCRQRNLRFVLVLSPLLEPYYLPTEDTAAAREMLLSREEWDGMREAMDRIRELAVASDVDLVDLGPLYARYGAEMKLLPFDHEHLGPAGHRRVAETLAERVK